MGVFMNTEATSQRQSVDASNVSVQPDKKSGIQGTTIELRVRSDEATAPRNKKEIKNKIKVVNSNIKEAKKAGDFEGLNKLRGDKMDLKLELGTFAKTNLLSLLFNSLKKTIVNLIPRKNTEAPSTPQEKEVMRVEQQVMKLVEEKDKNPSIDAGALRYIDSFDLENLEKIVSGLLSLSLEPNHLNIAAADLLIANEKEFTSDNHNYYIGIALEEHPELKQQAKTESAESTHSAPIELEKTAQQKETDKLNKFYDDFEKAFKESSLDIKSSPQEQYLAHLMNNKSPILTKEVLTESSSTNFLDKTKGEIVNNRETFFVSDLIAEGKGKDFMHGYYSFINPVKDKY